MASILLSAGASSLLGYMITKKTLKRRDEKIKKFQRYESQIHTALQKRFQPKPRHTPKLHGGYNPPVWRPKPLPVQPPVNYNRPTVYGPAIPSRLLPVYTPNSYPSPAPRHMAAPRHVETPRAVPIAPRHVVEAPRPMHVVEAPRPMHVVETIPFSTPPILPYRDDTCIVCKKQYTFNDITTQFMCDHMVHRDCINNLMGGEMKKTSLCVCPACNMQVQVKRFVRAERETPVLGGGDALTKYVESARSRAASLPSLNDSWPSLPSDSSIVSDCSLAPSSNQSLASFISQHSTPSVKSNHSTLSGKSNHSALSHHSSNHSAVSHHSSNHSALSAKSNHSAISHHSAKSNHSALSHHSAKSNHSAKSEKSNHSAASSNPSLASFISKHSCKAHPANEAAVSGTDPVTFFDLRGGQTCNMCDCVTCKSGDDGACSVCKGCKCKKCVFIDKCECRCKCGDNDHELSYDGSITELYFADTNTSESDGSVSSDSMELNGGGYASDQDSILFSTY